MADETTNEQQGERRMTDETFADDDPRNVILDAYPEAREFASLITAETVEDYTAVARAIATKVKNLKSKESNQQPSSPRTPKPEKDKALTVKEAIDSRDWSGFLASKWVEQNERGEYRG
jgi:hypothetical protein